MGDGDHRADLDFGTGARSGRRGHVIRLNPKTGKRHLDWLTWGLLPYATENPDTAPRPIHARAETVAELPMFAEAFRKRRAIVPAAEYYQQRTKGGPKERYAISRQDGRPMAIAGLWESHVWPDGRMELTYCSITIAANAVVAPIHDLMPLVLEEMIGRYGWAKHRAIRRRSCTRLPVTCLCFGCWDSGWRGPDSFAR
ncbi:MAG: SOS response-associated peptidase [Acidobacteriota bacterium]